ncbi:endonuclease [Lutibacter citreus]|uniref:endonuclease n=1 Tax=Lutibacter citreus TaxID=2138210 RepID=UPI000DBE68AB|nr:endonuclease [Lutibacter citreus]
MQKLLLLFFFTSFSLYSQIPADYYDAATDSGYILKTQLYNIIKDHTDFGYDGLYDTYETSDRDTYYENDNTILDMYSENPSGTDLYNYAFGVKKCGIYADEGDCYNREHIIPQSVFKENSPMRNDAHFVVPTDGKVNSNRSNYPHGTVGTQASSSPSKNGSKWGTSSVSGYTGTVFEPIDEFKGDIARMYFYFATRYENVLTTWGVSYGMFNGTTDQVFTDSFLTLLMTWHTNDPVSDTETKRNKAIYNRQGNANPFIDHPEYVALIWSTTPDTEAPTAPTNLTASNITNTTVDLNWTVSTDNVGVTSYEIFVDGSSYATSTAASTTLTGLTIDTMYDITVYAKDAFGNTSTVSNTENITTTNIIDTTNPSIPTTLVVSNETNTSIDLSWTASTDNEAIKEYDVYIDGILESTTSSTTFTASGLTPSTTYSFSVLARDTSDNESSSLSIAVDGTTTATPSFCGSETFTNIGASSSSYTSVNWTGDGGGTWNATGARTDQTITGKAITIKNGTLTTPTTANGIGELTVTTKLPFSDSASSINVKVNNVIVGNIPYSSSATTTTIPNINISGSITIVFDGSTSGNRVSIDDLSWSCFSSSDTETPSTIADLSASNVTNDSADLTWTVSTDNVGVTSYEIFKDGVFLASSTTNSYNVSGLTINTSYEFTVYAKDAAGNTSLVSNPENFTTTNIIDTTNPSIPTALVVSNETNTSIDLSWTASTDNEAIKEYDVYINGILESTTSSTTFTASGLIPSTTYSFSVLARDTSDNESSSLSIAVDGTTTATPSFCGSETFTNSNATSSYNDSSFTGDNGVTWTYTESRNDGGYSITGTSFMLRNTSSTLISSTVSNGIGEFTCSLLKGFTGSGDRQVALYVNDVLKGTSSAWDNTSVQTFTISGINISGDIIIEIRNTKGKQVIIDDISWSCFAISDTEAPSTIVGLSSSNVMSNSADLTWTAATDNIGVTSYEIFKDGVFLASSPTNSYTIPGLSGSTSYDFTVYAKDAAGNTSLVSNTETFTTLAGSSTPSELFISEYIEGSLENKALEITNFTGSAIDLSIYSLKINVNGASDWDTTILNLSGTLNNGDVFIAANSLADPLILAEADLTTSTAPLLFSGNDAIGLFKNDILIDLLGVVASDVDYAPQVTLRRKPTISSPNTTYTVSEWDIYPIDTFSGLGSHTLSSLSIQKFVKNLFNVYPNPTKTNSATISVKNNETIDAIQFYNLLGQLIVNIKNTDTYKNKIEVENIPSGFYIIKVFNDKTYSTKRLIVE